MTDFGKRVQAAEREVRSKAKPPQNRRKRKPSNTMIKPGERLSPATEFKPGVSGNPGGRPKRTPITDAMRTHLAKSYAGKEKKYAGMTNADVLAIKQFELAVEGGDMAAAKEIADRVEGKTIQISQLQGPHGGAIPYTSVSREENEARLAKLEAIAAGAEDGNDSN